MRLSIGKINR